MPRNDGYSEQARKERRDRETMFLRRLFAMLAKMAKADGRIDAWETHAAERAFDMFPRAKARRGFCRTAFNDAAHGRRHLYWYAWQFANKYATTDDCLKAYELLWDIACAKGTLDSRHKGELRGVCGYLNLPPGYFDIYFRKRSGTFRETDASHEDGKNRASNNANARRGGKPNGDRKREKSPEEEYEEARRRWQEKFRNWYKGSGGSRDDARRANQRTPSRRAEYVILGCTEDASDEEVRRAYHQAAKRNHPDVLRAQGASDVAIAEATRLMAKINEAWARIRKARNI